MRPPLQRATGLASVLRGVIAEMQQASQADIVSIFLYEEAATIESGLAAAERSALEGLGRLTSLLTAASGDARTDMKELRRVMSIALADLLLASELDAAAIYQFGPHRTSLELVTAHAPI